MNSFITQVLNQFSDNITDRVFLMIQEDKELDLFPPLQRIDSLGEDVKFLVDKLEHIENDLLFSVAMYKAGIAIILAISNNSGRNKIVASIRGLP